MYVVSKLASLGIFKTPPIDKRLDVRLLRFFIASTVVLYSLAIEYRESPLLTVYVMPVVSVSRAVGIFRTPPIDSILLVRLLAFFRASTVVLYLLAIA